MAARIRRITRKDYEMASNFDLLAQRLSQEKGVTNPRGLAYSIGAKKFGKKRMSMAAAPGVPATSIKKRG